MSLGVAPADDGRSGSHRHRSGTPSRPPRSSRRWPPTTSRGLTADEAQRRLTAYGANVLPVEPGRSVWRMILDQVADPMIALLVVAALISGIVGEPADTIVITVIVLLNAVIGVVQERRAEQAMAALRAMSAPTAVVVRDGIEQQVDAAELVPGDLVVLQDGAIVPADLRLTSLASLRIAEAALTGESQPVSKRVEPVTDPHAPVGDRRSMAFRGTFVAQGRGRGVVVGTGTADRARRHRRPADDRRRRPDPPAAPAVELRRPDRAGRRRHLRHRVRHGPAARRGPGADVPDRDQPRRRRRPGGPARGRRRDAGPRRAADGPPQRARAAPARGGDPRVGHLDLLGQDRDADREPDARRGAGAVPPRDGGDDRNDPTPGQRDARCGPRWLAGRRRHGLPWQAPRCPRPLQRRDPARQRHPGHRATPPRSPCWRPLATAGSIPRNAGERCPGSTRSPSTRDAS